ncbi:exodeoxyribonuclease VII large subunit [Candidatus Vallotia tarda]|uniref:Exodeoxyribonuclease 7 large subunit n=1 Tax=Candidatus Vallotiella hemipterorum TaxID=1177213 RepID=A0A916JSQ9_9BURK|nr:exodeoxyribonuclease VII large subunit [Candidatus Vallotia tarda]CAG7600325.1 Exodeoxyribonuclease 7 large subunit [Candidatus Vallotia tarda]
MTTELPSSIPFVSRDIVIPVSDVNHAIGILLGRTFSLSWIAGEVSNFTRAVSGHWYFSIKDHYAQIRCVMFRGRAQYAQLIPQEGDLIEVRATVAIYEPRGELQLNVEEVRHTGQGRLYEAFLKLKTQLETEGLFTIERKRELPLHPRAIGIVTSPKAAALRDVLITLSRRAPHVPIIVYPTQVQGAEAASRVVEIIGTANRRAEVDVLILCRGGGSIEDLWVFNDESLARAIASSVLPIVSGVGHETDFTIADFTADIRAPTPTAAAELVSAPRAVLLCELVNRHAALAGGFRRMIERRAQHLDSIAHRLVSPAERIARQLQYLRQVSLRLRLAGKRPARDARARLTMVLLRWKCGHPDIDRATERMNQLWQNLHVAMHRYNERRNSQVYELATRIELLSPQRTLERGYAALIDLNSGSAVRTPAELKAGQRVTAHLAQGSADISIAHVQLRLNDEF